MFALTIIILESWGDANPYAGQYSLAQPAIYPLFSKKFPRENVESKYEGTRLHRKTLLKWAGSEETDYYTYMQNYWKKNFFLNYRMKAEIICSLTIWNKTLQSGVFEKDAD